MTIIESKTELTVGSNFDLYLSTRLEFSISTFQLDSKPDSGRIVKRSKPDSNRVESGYSTRSAKNPIFWPSIDLAAAKAALKAAGKASAKALV